jgi:L-ascorbate metabolism protein UlaG (beta-lactamase superfamily)
MTVRYEGLTFDRPGHATVRIETDDGLVCYVDPWSQVLEDEPRDADVVLVTHDDHDHYDPDGIEAVSTPDTVVVAYEAIDASDLDREVTTIGEEEATTIAGIDVHSIRAYNETGGEHVDEDGNPYHARGEGIGLLLTFDDSTVFVPSDTDVLDVHRTLFVDVFVPPIGGHYTMDRHEAADLAATLEPDLVLPVHYDTFEAIETDAEAFAEELEAKGIRVELF